MEKNKGKNEIEIPEIELPKILLLTERVIPEEIKIANRKVEKSTPPHIEPGNSFSPSPVIARTQGHGTRKR
ncbi:MAG: hypothetical protein AABY33_09630 [Pseudomonadota bacterium]